MNICAIIVAAGRGTRAGYLADDALPKQFRYIAGRPVLARTIDRFATHPAIDQIVVVTHPDHRERVMGYHPDIIPCDGGHTRKASVANGLAAVPGDTTHVLIHDGARPCVPHDVIDRVVDALGSSPAAAPALAVTDALWHTENRRALAPAPRDHLARAQTPQGFEIAAIRDAHAQQIDADDDVGLAIRAGIDVTVVEGSEDNIKITGPEDFARATRILENHMDIRTGTGFDVHRFTDGDGVILCGVLIPHSARLLGHSDADVAMHAITDAIYGALADGDIGQHFPPSDPQWKGAASDIFLRHAVELAKTRGFSISNIDCTILCEEPKIGPHALAMRQNLATITGVSVERISVKATTTERLGFTGRKEGIAAQAAATLIST